MQTANFHSSKSVSFKIIIQNQNKHVITVRYRTNLDRTGTEQAQNEQGTRTGARSLSLNFLSVLVLVLVPFWLCACSFCAFLCLFCACSVPVLV